MKLFKRIRKIASETKAKLKRIGVATLCSIGVYVLVPMQVYASNPVEQRINNITTFVVTIIAAAGSVVLAFAGWDFAEAWKAQDPSAQTLAIRKIISGLIMIFIGVVIGIINA